MDGEKAGKDKEKMDRRKEGVDGGMRRGTDGSKKDRNEVLLAFNEDLARFLR